MLELAGATQVLHLDDTMAQALSRRVIGNNNAAHVIGDSHGLLIAEANAADTELVGHSLTGSGIEAIIGDATHLDVLRKARAREASAIIITPHDDDTNISLTIFFRRLRPSFQIIARCSLERNVRTLHRAGADLVLSSASMGANTVFNELRDTDHLLLAEGVCLFPSPVPDSMAGRLVSE